LYRAVDKAGDTVDFLFRAKREKAAARRYFEKAITGNGVPETVTIDKSGANLAGLNAINADREVPIKIRQSKHLNNVLEVRHDVAYRSCSHFSPHGRSEPPVSPGESRSLNQERL
jgi:putative transposase